MSVILWASSIIAAILIILFIIEIRRKNSDESNLIGLVTFFGLDLLIGFLILGTNVPIKESNSIYIEPSSKFFDDKCVVVVNNETVFFSIDSKNVTKAKNGIVKLAQFKKLNSYGVSCDGQLHYRIAIFSEEEWNKIINEKP